jgi:hypothetical protein
VIIVISDILLSNAMDMGENYLGRVTATFSLQRYNVAQKPHPWVKQLLKFQSKLGYFKKVVRFF